MSEDAKKIMEILYDERRTEMQCREASLEILKKIRNPIKRISAKRALTMFTTHIAALTFAIIRIEKELKLRD